MNRQNNGVPGENPPQILMLVEIMNYTAAASGFGLECP